MRERRRLDFNSSNCAEVTGKCGGRRKKSHGAARARLRDKRSRSRGLADWLVLGGLNTLPASVFSFVYPTTWIFPLVRFANAFLLRRFAEVKASAKAGGRASVQTRTRMCWSVGRSVGSIVPFGFILLRDRRRCYTLQLRRNNGGTARGAWRVSAIRRLLSFARGNRKGLLLIFRE